MRGVSQSNVDRFHWIPQLHETDLLNYQLSRFFAERLLHVITLLDQNKEMLICPKSTKHHTRITSDFITLNQSNGRTSIYQGGGVHLSHLGRIRTRF